MKYLYVGIDDWDKGKDLKLNLISKKISKKSFLNFFEAFIENTQNSHLSQSVTPTCQYQKSLICLNFKFYSKNQY